MSNNPDILALTPIVEAFESLKVFYYVGGSVASSAYGLSRSTVDADVIADLHQGQVQRFADMLTGPYYVSEPMIRDAISRRSSFNVIHIETMFKIDVFAVKDRPFDYAACRRTRREVLDSKQGKQFVLAAPEDVILNKLEWYRLGEEMSDRQWRDVIEVIRIQHGRLDLEHLEFWARELKVLDLLNEAITEVENKEA